MYNNDINTSNLLKVKNDKEYLRGQEISKVTVAIARACAEL